VLSACGSPAPSAGPAATGTAPVTSGGTTKDIFAIGQSTPITNLNPNPWSAISQVWRRAIFDTLVTVDPQPQPSLATAWHVSADGTVYTFTIRSGVKFQNGKIFDSQSVVDNLKWAADPKNNVTGGAVLAQAAYEAPDSTTVTITFPRPAPQLLSTLAVIPMWDLTSDLNTAPVGTGSFAVSSFVPNTDLLLVRNDNYWDQQHLPKVRQFDIRNYADNATANLALAAGQIDVLASPPFRDVPILKKGGMSIQATTAPGSFMLRMNTASGPGANKYFRQALGAAIDRNSFVTVAGGGVSQPTCSVYPPGSSVYDASIESTCGFDPERAKSLLAQSGLTTPVSITLDTSDVRQPELAAFAPVLQQDAAKVGINIQINAMAPTLMAPRLLTGQYDIQTDWYPWGNLDPALLFITRTFAPDLTFEKFTDPNYTEMVLGAQALIDPATRLEAYKKLNQYMVDQAFVIPIATRPYLYAVRTDVVGFNMDPLGQVDATGVTVGR